MKLVAISVAWLKLCKIWPTHNLISFVSVSVARMCENWWRHYWRVSRRKSMRCQSAARMPKVFSWWSTRDSLNCLVCIDTVLDIASSVPSHIILGKNLLLQELCPSVRDMPCAKMARAIFIELDPQTGLGTRSFLTRNDVTSYFRSRGNSVWIWR